VTTWVVFIRFALILELFLRRYICLSQTVNWVLSVYCHGWVAQRVAAIQTQTKCVTPSCFLFSCMDVKRGPFWNLTNVHFNRGFSSCRSMGLWLAGWSHLYCGVKNSGSRNAWLSEWCNLTPAMRCTLWIQLLCNVATLQPVSLGGGTGGHSSHRGPCPPGHPLEPPLNLKLFTMSCQRRILRIRWFDHVTNVDVISQAGREDLAAVISSDDVWRSLNMFVDYWRRQQVGWHCGWLLTWPDNNPCWKRQRRHNWLGQSDVDDS